MNNDFKKIEQFRKLGKTFMVEITHYEEKDFDGVEQCWFVYVYIFTKNKLNKKARQNKDDYDCVLGNELYPAFDGGCTFYHKNDDYVQIGCDYRHIWNEEEQHSKELPPSVKECAYKCFEYFSKLENS